VSRVGNQPIKVPEGVTISVNADVVSVNGPKGALTVPVKPVIIVKQEGQTLLITRKNDDPKYKALHGLFRSLIANAVFGVTTGWSKQLELAGVGYKASTTGSELTLNVGFSHSVIIKAPAGITFEVKDNKITVNGFDKQLVGEISAQIRRIRPPEPYKGKGIHYMGEKLRKKLGKAAKTIGAATGAK
jgi:large subunit ribosomal protein L6